MIILKVKYKYKYIIYFHIKSQFFCKNFKSLYTKSLKQLHKNYESSLKFNLNYYKKLYNKRNLECNFWNMSTITLENKNNMKLFFVKNTTIKKKWLSDFKKYIIKSWKKQTENISENIDTFLYN